jgi:hypothetical protein
MSKVYAGLLVAIALIAMAAIGTLALVAITDVGYLAYRVPKPGMNPERGAIIRSLLDPSRHFTTINYCTAKGSFDHLVGSAEQGAEATIHREPSQSWRSADAELVCTDTSKKLFDLAFEIISPI